MKPHPLFIILLSLGSNAAYGHGGGEASIEVGPTKGVTEVASDKSFKLAPEATQTLGIQTVSFVSGSISVPRSALVTTLQENQVFRIRDGYLRPISFKSISSADQKVVIQSTDLKSGDGVVVSGVGFLRIIAAQLGKVESPDEHTDSHVDEHAHDHEHGSEGGAHHD